MVVARVDQLGVWESGQFGISAGVICDECRINLDSTCDRLRINIQSILGYFETTSEMIENVSAVSRLRGLGHIAK